MKSRAGAVGRLQRLERLAMARECPWKRPARGIAGYGPGTSTRLVAGWVDARVMRDVRGWPRRADRHAKTRRQKASQEKKRKDYLLSMSTIPPRKVGGWARLWVVGEVCPGDARRGRGP